MVEPADNEVRSVITKRTHWVFDMDGTLTVAAHDFAAIKRHLDIPPDQDILGHLSALPLEERNKKYAWLWQHEKELALNASPAQGAQALLELLSRQGRRMGVLTRNHRELAWITLRAVGLDHYFQPNDVLGRDDAIPKPDPAGLLELAKRWQVPAHTLVMVGDSVHDINAGHNAGAFTCLVNYIADHDKANVPSWHQYVDLQLSDCTALADMLKAASSQS